MTVAGSLPAKGAPGQRKSPAKKAPAKSVAKKTPSKAVAVIKKDAKLASDLSPAKAKALTAQIKSGVQGVSEKLHAAYMGRIWVALGHKTWDDWIQAEFQGAPLALPMAKRKPTVANLAERGWSTRAIAAATGESQSTIARDVKDAKQVNQNGSVPPEVKDDNILDIPESDITELPEGEGPPADEDAPKVVGLDGKQRPATGSKTPNVVPITQVARAISKDLVTLTVRLGALYDREDYEANKVEVDGALQQAIDDFAEEVGDRLPELEPEPA